MTTPNKAREAFEAWFSEGGKYFQSIERSKTNPDGYKLSQAQCAWSAYQAACADRDKVIAVYKDFIEEITKAGGKYTYLDQTQIVVDAYAVLTKAQGA